MDDKGKDHKDNLEEENTKSGMRTTTTRKRRREKGRQGRVYTKNKST